MYMYTYSRCTCSTVQDKLKLGEGAYCIKPCTVYYYTIHLHVHVHVHIQ